MPELARQPAGMRGVNAGTCCAQLLLCGSEPLPAPVPCHHTQSKAPAPPQPGPPHKHWLPMVRSGEDGGAGLAARQSYGLGRGRVPVQAVCPSSWYARSCRICFGVNHVFWSLDSHESLPTSSVLARKVLGGGAGGPGMGEGPLGFRVLLAGEGRRAFPGLLSRSLTWGWS